VPKRDPLPRSHPCSCVTAARAPHQHTLVPWLLIWNSSVQGKLFGHYSVVMYSLRPILIVRLPFNFCPRLKDRIGLNQTNPDTCSKAGQSRPSVLFSILFALLHGDATLDSPETSSQTYAHSFLPQHTQHDSSHNRHQ
jgi:hypothetical protein